MSDTTEVKLHFLDYWRVVKARAGIIILVFLLTMITAGVTVYFMPREFFSHSSIEVKPDNTAAGALNIYGTQPGNPGSDSKLAPTQFQIIQDKGILYPVIDQLKLTTKWAGGGPPMQREQAYNILRGMLEMSEVRGTDLIDIGIWSTDRQEAADIANTITSVYQDIRRKNQLNNVDTGLDRLLNEVNDQKKDVAELGAKAEDIRNKLHIVDPDTETMGNTNGTIEIDPVMTIQKDLDEQKLNTSRLQTQLDQVNKLKPEELMVALQMLEIQDATVQKILPLYQDTVSADAEARASGLGPNHPRIKEIEARQVAYRGQLDDAIKAIKATMVTRLELAKTTQSVLEQRLKDANSAFMQLKDSGGDYTEAKYKYIEAKKMLDAAQLRYSTEEAQRGIGLEVAKIWEQAEPANSPGKPRVTFYMLLAAIAGLGLGTGLAFFLEYLDTSVKSLEDVERFLGIPVLAVIPKNVGLLRNQKGDSPDAETYRILRTNIEFNRKNPDANSLTLISGGPGEGKSTTLFNLAYTCAKGGYSVLVVDADLRRPSQHRLFGVENNVGLSNYLTSNQSFQEFVRTTEIENLSFIPSGHLSGDAVGILNSQRMTDLIRNTKAQYDLVMFDAPPILGVSDGAVLASEVDMAIMVIEHRRFPRSMLLRVKQAITNVGGNLVGVVLNKVDAKNDGYGYYGTYYNYYSNQNGQPATGQTPEHEVAPVVPTNGRHAAGAAAKQEVHEEQY